MPSAPDSRPHMLRRQAARRRRAARLAIGALPSRVAAGAGAILLGLAALLFARLGDAAQHWFARCAAALPYAPLLITPAAFAFTAWATRRWSPGARGSGIPQVIAASRDPDAPGREALVSMRTALSKVGLTLLVLAGGGPVGREGPTVQLSAAVMVACHRLLRVPLSPGILIAGGAAGVAAAFNTPLAGIAFAIEELAAAYEQRVTLLVMGAVMVAGMVSLGIAGDYVYFGVMGQTLPLVTVLAVAPLAGVTGGLAGGAFTRVALAFADTARPWMRSLKARPVLLAGALGLFVAILGIAGAGATWGTGYEETRRLVEGHDLPLWFGPAKFLAALATTLSGVPGGVFAPSLSVGAGLGNLLAPLFPDAAPGPIVLLAMIAYFVGVVRAPLTGVIILSEATASRGMLIPLLAAALIADFVSGLVCKERLYHGLARPFLKPAPPTA